MPVQSFKVGEMLNKRTPNSKTWINFDGSYTTEIHQGIIHYEDASGNLHNINTDLFDEADFNEIDFPVAKDGDSLFYEQQAKAAKDKKKNRLNRENYDFQGLAVPYECRIPRNIRSGYSIGKGASKLKFIPVGASVSKGYAEGNKITYPDVWNDADLVLELLPEGIKETIILKTDKAPINFSFEVQGELAEELKIQPMWLMDAEGTKRDVLQGVSEVDDKVLLNIAADTSNLVYPIEVDPTVTIKPDEASSKDAYVEAYYPNNSGDNSTLLWVGNTAGMEVLTFIQFSLSNIPAGSVVSAADLILYQDANYYYNFYTGVYEVTSAWNESVTYNTKPTISNTLQSQVYAGNTGGGFKTFPISVLVNNWVNGTKQNYGVCLKAVSTPNGSNDRIAYRSSFDTETIRPSLVVTFNQPPTAPVVTAPNGGETWNSQHTVTWQAATDPSSIDTVVSTTSTNNIIQNFLCAGQIFISKKDAYLKSLSINIADTTGLGSNVRVTLRNAVWDGIGGYYVPGTTIYATKDFAINSSFVDYLFTLPSLLKFPINTVLSIDVEALTGNFKLGGATSNVYTDGPNLYYTTSRSTGYNANTGTDARIVLNYETAAQGSDLKYQIQLSTDNGASWSDIVTLTNPGITSYLYDFINKPETSVAKIRIRAYDGSAYGPWDESNGVFTIQHNQAPTAPTGLNPSGEPKDRASVVRFGWLHNDPNAGDPQSKFDLQWRVQGSPTWNTVTQATTNNYYDMPAGTLPKATIEWQVRTYDQAGLPSPYSALQVFIAGDKPPTPTITGPVNGSVVPVSKPVVQWSSVDQAAYQVNVLNSSGSTTLWTTGQVNSGNKAVTVGIDLENNTDYKIQTLVRGAEGIWSNAAVSNINVSYTPPALPVLTTVASDLAGSITVNVENPTPTGTEPTVSFNDLYRRETGGTWERIATNLANNGSYMDYTVASGQTYEYKVIAIGDNETIRESLLASDSINLKGIYLHVVQNAQNTSYRFLMGEQKSSSLWNLSHTFHKFAGRKNLVIDTEDATDYGVNFTLKLRTDLDIQALESIIYSQDVVCYRDSRGRKVFGVFVTFPMDDEFWGENTSLNLTEIDYKEEI